MSADAGEERDVMERIASDVRLLGRAILDEDPKGELLIRTHDILSAITAYTSGRLQENEMNNEPAQGDDAPRGSMGQDLSVRGWLPIIGARTDRAEFRLLLPDGSERVGRFHGGRWQTKETVANKHKTEGRCGEPAQILPHIMRVWANLPANVYPTHWQPLPLPPTEID